MGDQKRGDRQPNNWRDLRPTNYTEAQSEHWLVDGSFETSEDASAAHVGPAAPIQWVEHDVPDLGELAASVTDVLTEADWQSMPGVRQRLERQVIETAMAVHAITVPDMDAFDAAVVARDEACEALARWREENP